VQIFPKFTDLVTISEEVLGAQVEMAEVQLERRPVINARSADFLLTPGGHGRKAPLPTEKATIPSRQRTRVEWRQSSEPTGDYKITTHRFQGGRSNASAP